MNANFLKSIAILTVFCLFMNSCKDDDDIRVSAVTVEEATYVNNIMQISLKDNATLQLTPFIMPRNATNTNVEYMSVNDNVFTVSASGLITPKSVGIDTLVVSATDGSGVRTSYTVNITDHMVKATGITVTSEGSNMSIKIGATFDLGACVTITPDDTWDKSVTYTTSDASIATVNANGIVTAVAAGTAVITIKTADGSNISRNCNVTVLDFVEREVDLDRTGWTVTTSVSYSDGKNYVTDGATGKPEDMFDGDGATFLSMVKTGKNYGSWSGTTPGYEVNFKVDLKSKQKISYLRWQHRQGNSLAYLRVWGVNVLGSNDDATWTTIKSGVTIPIAGITPSTPDVNQADPNNYRVDLGSESEYRYIKIDITKWSDNAGGATSGSTLQIGEFGLGYTFLE